MKKLPLLLATLLTATIVTVGCSKKEDQSAAPAADTTASAPAAAAPASDAGATMSAPASDAGAAAPAPASN
ncbi:hypothetical protein UC34_06485 [Pandoraea vervacti]|uniref:Endopeptidase n=1 Tax=Pandoraea vervacti TaxID=656178 RepID=A0ABM5SW60_9BURK|nr:hypothetical protein [Pandoraea vervacti]AJP56728.1 hypothetical protein UC34_06485 [Pandoraea vervacti]